VISPRVKKKTKLMLLSQIDELNVAISGEQSLVLKDISWDFKS